MVDGINLGEGEVRKSSEAAPDHEADQLHAEGRELLKSVIEQARAELTSDSEVSAQAVAEKVWTTLREKVGEVERQNPKVVLAAAESFIKDVDPQAFFDTKKPEVAWQLMMVLYLALKNAESRLQVATKTKIETPTSAAKSDTPKKKLQIEIDRGRLTEKVTEITESDYFNDIAQKAKELRNERYQQAAATAAITSREAAAPSVDFSIFDLEAETIELQQLITEAIQAMMRNPDNEAANLKSQDVTVDLAKAFSAARNEIASRRGSAKVKEIDLRKMPTVDQRLKKREVAKITESDYFLGIQAKVADLRRRAAENAAALTT